MTYSIFVLWRNWSPLWKSHWYKSRYLEMWLSMSLHNSSCSSWKQGHAVCLQIQEQNCTTWGLKGALRGHRLRNADFFRYLEYDAESCRMRDGGYLVFSIDSLTWQKIMYLNLYFVDLVLFSVSGNWRDILQHEHYVFCQSFQDP